MNREFDKEIDLLLRRHTRAAARGRVFEDEGAAHSPQSAHLDADELSAFAENALPAASRSLYVAHLADCGECRRAVAGLAGSSNVSVGSERKAAASTVPGESVAAASRGGWLAALFAPRSMRYALPALALCLVGVIAFVALRSTQREAGQLAVHKDSENGKARDSITLEARTAGSPGVGVQDGATQNANASDGAGQTAPNFNQSPQPVQPAGQQAGGGGAALRDAPATGPAPNSPEALMAPPPAPPVAAKDTQEAAGLMAEAAPAPKAVSKEKGENAKALDVTTRESKSENFTLDGASQQSNRAGQPRRVDIDQMPDGSRNTQRSDPSNAGSRANNNFPTLSRQQTETDRAARSPARRGRSSEMRDERRGDEETTAGAETRSVSGHRFRRQDGAWVDVRYSTSQPTTGVRRGTDGYRALVADIPEIGRIAEQLAGEVVVVVKGRAYRIR
jgi:hypothetical protein